MDNNLLNVHIISPREEVFNGKALSVSSTNSVGRFDILPEHAKFVTVVERKPIILRFHSSPSQGRPDKREQKFEFEVAIIHVHNDQVDIYINPSESGLK